jgi:glycerol-3-phosphate dehydrogenase subunit B
MTAGDLTSKEPIAIVGFDGYLDFFAGLIADNLSAQGYVTKEINLNLQGIKSRKLKSSIHLAMLFESKEFREEVVVSLRNQLGTVRRVGFPAVLGLENSTKIHQELEDQLGCKVFEIPTIPPSIPGIRLHNLLVKAIKESGGRVFNGMEVVQTETSGGEVRSILSEAAARLLRHRANNFVLATGGILGGGIVAHEDGGLAERIFHLPCVRPTSRLDWFSQQFITSPGQAVFRTGIVVNREMNPIDPNEQVLFKNLQIAGTTIAGGDYLREKSMDGVDLVSAYKIGGSLKT